MAKMTMNRIVEALWGKLGNLVYRQRPDGTIIVSETPEQDKKKATQKQKNYRQQFGQRSQYASRLAKQHPIYAELASREEAKAKWLSPFNFALSDCAHPPEIHRVERREGWILVEASDNIMVAKVIVMIYDENNKVLESGDAVRREGNMWEFACHAEGKILRVQAWDLARNVTNLEVELNNLEIISPILTRMAT